MSNLVRRVQAGKFLSPAAAINFIQRQKVQRVYKETPALELLGMEDELAHRIPWLKEHKRPVDKGDEARLGEVREELARRPSAEMEPVRVEWIKRNKILSYFPDEGPLNRSMYPKHIAYIAAGKHHRERLACGSNRSGKTLLASYEVVTHTTGRYPHWWEGYRFDEAPDTWIVNKSAKDVRDINETELLGTPGDLAKRGTAMLPAHLIHSVVPKPGTPNGYEFINVKHISGDTTQIQSKSFDQGREAFQGRSKPLIWLDEEAPVEVYTECLLRTLDCGGLILLTYTPLLGLTELTVQFLEDAGVSIDAIGKEPEESAVV